MADATAEGERLGGTQRLAQAAQEYLAARAQHAAEGLTRKLDEVTGKLADSPRAADLVTAGQKLAEGKSPARAALATGAAKAKNSLLGGVKDKLGGLSGKADRGKGGNTNKSVVIVEDIDVGVPARVAYDQWTQFQEFGSWAKGVVSVETEDELSSNWNLKIFLSNRTWKANVTEQKPDERIAWTSEGAKATTKGVVTFHPLGERLTKVLLVIEYSPMGFVEKTANLWRAQGRRARLDLKLYRHLVMSRGEATGAWRGEISDGEVVRSHEDATQQEEDARDERDEDDQYGDERAEDDYDDEYDDESAEYDDDDEYDDDYEDEPAAGQSPGDAARPNR
jgi:uncharacterized membrane protein